jgi:hypothetical protein
VLLPQDLILTATRYKSIHAKIKKKQEPFVWKNAAGSDVKYCEE